MDLQPRLFWGVMKPNPNIPIGPVVGLNFSFDTANNDYDRFLEINYGVKAKWFLLEDDGKHGTSLGAQVYGVQGFRTDSDTSLPSYQDFRILLYGYFSY